MAAQQTELTPMKRQYNQIKERNRDCILFFRLGDFYEMFYDEAEKISRELELTLTARAGVPMCGVPYHACEVYLKKLIELLDCIPLYFKKENNKYLIVEE